VHVFPAGVDVAAFRSGGEAPADIAGMPRPRVGYTGGQPHWFDAALLRQVATKLPDVQFVLVGPTDVETLRALPNVHILGPRPHARLPAYLHAFDAGIIPYELSEYTISIYPAKVNEYFAAGLPVVSTSLPELVRLRQQHGEVVRIADNADDFASAIRAALADREDATLQTARLEIARANDWNTRVAAMAALINARLS
jgi:UDP-galactopyranose mutase